MASFPTTVEEITPKWLTGALRDAGVLPTGSVSDVQAETIAVGQGFVGSLARLTLTYVSEYPGVPSSLIAKFPSRNQETKGRIIQMGIYEREVKFYRELAYSLPIRTPRCYYSGLDSETGEFLLLLEDLSSLRGGDQISGLNSTDIPRALDQLALLHAAKWNDASLNHSTWLPGYDVGAQSAGEGYDKNWSVFQEIQLFRLSDDAIELGHRLVGNIQTVKEYLARPPVTLLHGDFRLDNLLFGEPGSPKEVVVLDWQLCKVGNPSWDIAYCTAGLALQQRIEAIASYHKALIRCGIADYTWEQCLLDCRWAALDSFNFWVDVCLTVDFNSPRGQIFLNEVIPMTLEMAAEFGAEALP